MNSHLFKSEVKRNRVMRGHRILLGVMVVSVLSFSHMNEAVSENLSNIYKENCMGCHGRFGKGAGINPPIDRDDLSNKDVQQLVTLIKEGNIGKKNAKGFKMGFEGTISDSCIQKMVEVLTDHGMYALKGNDC